MTWKPFGHLVAFHRKEPVGAAALVFAVSMLVAMASYWSHRLFESGHAHATVQSAAITAGALVLWLVVAAVVVAFWVRKDSRSHVLPFVIAWFIIAMAQVGARADAIDVPFMRTLYMAILSGIGYILTTTCLREKYVRHQQEDAMTAFRVARAAPDAQPEGNETLVPREK